MLFQRFYDDDLAQASYLVGCERTRVALVVDPNRDIERYVDAAAAQQLTITFVTETHIHADFASGARALANRTGATLLLSGEGGTDWSYAFSTVRTQLLHDKDTVDVGRLRVKAMHTPGHTPEHLTFLVTDLEMGDAPIGAFTGDFIFVGDVGRPDLLERAARQVGTMESSARALFASLQRFKSLPDYLQLWTGHGAGSACGKSLGSMPQSTLGFERRFNWGLAEEDETRFVTAVLDGQPEPPRYFARMKTLNRDDQIAEPLPLHPPLLEARVLPEALARSAQIVDVRPDAEFAKRHALGSINVPSSKSFATYAGSVIDYDRDLYLIGTRDAVSKSARALALIGYDRVAGAFDAGAFDAGAFDAGTTNIPELALTSITQISTEELKQHLAEGAHVLDVRNTSEWNEGHIPGAVHIPLAQLRDRLGEIPADGTLILQCQGGSRSAIAASVLESLGRPDLANFAGGYRAWEQAT